MKRPELSEPPIVEAILEVKWKLQPESTGGMLDEQYGLLPGKLHDRISGEYPFHEQLPAASVPDSISPYIPKHRFRTAKDEWPLVQIGPGLLTVNDTKKYTTYDHFRPRAVAAVNHLYEVCNGKLDVTSVLLRYIDAVEFDHRTQNVLDFLRDKMQVSVDMPTKLFAGTGAEARPNEFQCVLAFDCMSPKGITKLAFATRLRYDKPVFVWEHLVQSTDSDVPAMPTAFGDWLDAAHRLTDDWFFKLIEGELVESFS